MKGAASDSTMELAVLLARAYLRLLTVGQQGLELAQDPAAQESPTGLRIGVDVAGRAKHELVPEGYP